MCTLSFFYNMMYKYEEVLIREKQPFAKIHSAMGCRMHHSAGRAALSICRFVIKPVG